MNDTHDETDDFNDWPAYQPPASAGRTTAPVSPIPALPKSVQQKPSTAIPFPFSNKPDHFPGIFSRSALFSAIRSTKSPEPVVSMEIKAQGDYSIVLDGHRLSMFDKSVFESVIRIAKASSHNLAEQLECSLSEIALHLGWEARGGRDLQCIFDSLARIASTSIDYRLLDGVMRSGRLIGSVEKGRTGISIGFDAGLILATFGIDKQFKFDQNRRALLDGALAQWLHDYISTHTKDQSMLLTHYLGLCGYGARSKSFPEKLGIALDEIKAKAPELVAGIVWNKPTKSSERWKIEIVKGSEKASFIDPAKKHAAPAKPASTRSGVAL